MAESKIPHGVIGRALIKAFHPKFYGGKYFIWKVDNRIGFRFTKKRVGYVEIDNMELKQYIQKTYDIMKKAKAVTKDCDTGLVSQTLGFLERKGYITEAKIDLNLMYVDNGTLDTKNGELIGDDFDTFVPTRLNIDFNKKAECPTIDTFFDDVTRNKNDGDKKGDNLDDILTLEEIPGYILEPTYYIKKVPMLQGPRHTGKTTYLNLNIDFIGNKNISGLSLYDFDDKFSIPSIHNKLLNVRDDIGKRVLSEHAMGLLRELTGGEREFSTRRIRQDVMRIVPRAKFLFTMNDFPSLVHINSESTGAFIDRMLVEEFPNKFPTNDELPLKMKLELSGLLNKALEAKMRLRRQKQFSITKGGQGFDELYEIFKKAKISGTKIDPKWLLNMDEDQMEDELNTYGSDLAKY